MFLAIFVCESNTTTTRESGGRHEWEVRVRDREAYPDLVSQHTHDLLMETSLLKFFHEGRSLRGNFALLQ
jgi:hypothetical protein